MKRLGIVLLLLLTSLPAFAWTRTSDQRIASKAAQLAPSDLRSILEKYNTEYLLGLQKAESDEGSAAHHYFTLSREGRLRDKIEKETRELIAGIRGTMPMRDVAERLGGLAHYIADANNPFHIANDDPRLSESHDDFEQYFERRMAKFPTVFYGLDSGFQLSPYLDKTFSRTAKFYPLLSEEYFRYGSRRTSADFDDRSTAFGVAAVCYSRAVSDLVNLYYYIWKEAGGDVRSASAMRGGNLLLNAN